MKCGQLLAVALTVKLKEYLLFGLGVVATLIVVSFVRQNVSTVDNFLKQFGV